MNKIIPLINSIILYFLFPFYFFTFQIFISKFSKLKKFFQKIFHILWGIFVPRFLIHALYPPLWCVYFHTLKRCRITTLSLYQTKVHNHSLECMNIHFPFIDIYGKIFQPWTYVFERLFYPVFYRTLVQRTIVHCQKFTEHVFANICFMLNFSSKLFPK